MLDSQKHKYIIFYI